MTRATRLLQLPLVVVLLASLACAPSTSNDTGAQPDAQATPPPADRGEPAPTPASADGISDDLRAKVCAAENVDASSQIFLARDASGALQRVVVTPSRGIADMGNLVFDTNGALLGHDTGGEFPWDDEKLMAEERKRVAELMGGASIAEGETPLACK